MKKLTQISYRGVCFLLAVIVMVSAASTVNAIEYHPFTDVKEGSWYESSVVYVYENSLMNGTAEDLFAPDLTMSRAMLATVLHRYAGIPTAADHPFTDVESGSWYDAAVAWAYENGIVNGTSSTTFAPNEDVTREQMMAIFYRFADCQYLEMLCDADINNYTDADQISQYAQDPFKWAVSTGVINGVGNDMLAPKGNATRSQCAAVIERFIHWTENDAVIDLTALEQYGRDYAYKTYGYDGNPNCNPDTGASYYPGYKVSFTTAEEAKGYIREKIDNQHRNDTYYEQTITMNKEDGSIARCQLNIYIEVVTESFGQPTEDVYIIWCYVGGHAEPYHQDYWNTELSTKPEDTTTYPEDPATCTHHWKWAPPKLVEYPTVDSEGKEFCLCLACGFSFYRPIPKRDIKFASIPNGIMIIERTDDVLYYTVEPDIRLNDYRDWGDLPTIKILEDASWEVSYHDKENIQHTFIIKAPKESANNAAIRNNGEYIVSNDN